MAAVTLTLIGFFAFIILRVSRPDMGVLFSDLSMQDSASVVRELDSRGIRYETRGDAGQTILAPRPDLAKLRMDLAGKGLPTFLGGSAIAVTGKSQQKALAQEWVKYFTDTQSQEGLIAKGALPNATSLLDKAAAVKGNEATALAAKNSWFVPMAPKWADVESQNVLQQMLRDIATGTKKVPDAAKWADDQIAKILNA